MFRMIILYDCMDEIINSLTIITKPKDAPKGSLAKALKKLDEIVEVP